MMESKVVYHKFSTPMSDQQEVADKALDESESDFIPLDISTKKLIATEKPKKWLRTTDPLILVGSCIFVTFCLCLMCMFYIHFTESLPHNSENADYDLGNDIYLLTREEWGGREILDGYQNRTLVHPIKLVIIGHTASCQCMTLRGCASSLQTIQTLHVSKNNYVDIGYNFLVGGDGDIYQALGWDIQNYLRNNSIQIQFIGNYGFDKVFERQWIGVESLLARGVKLGKLDKDYLLIAHNHVANTESPGKNLVTEIKHWPHYYNGTLP